MHKIDAYFYSQPEPLQGTLLALKNIIMKHDDHIRCEIKYGMPFFTFHGKMFCYLWLRKQTQQPYIGFVEGKHMNENDLLQEKRSRMKIFLIDCAQDIPITRIHELLTKALLLYSNGTINFSYKY